MKIVSLASILSFQAPNLVNEFANDDFFVISPLSDETLSNTAKNAEFIKCEIGSIPYVLALACKIAIENEFFKDLDEGELSGESNVGDEEVEEICAAFTDAEECIVSPEIFDEDNAECAKEMLNLLAQYYCFEIVDLNGEKISLKGELKNLKTLDNYDGAVIFTHDKKDEFRGGEYFAAAAKLKDGQEISIKTRFGTINAVFRLDNELKGTVAFLGGSNFKYGFEPLKRA